jgi:hypothetical protein
MRNIYGITMLISEQQIYMCITLLLSNKDAHCIYILCLDILFHRGIHSITYALMLSYTEAIIERHMRIT